jgi:hypothetical protein
LRSIGGNAQAGKCKSCIDPRLKTWQAKILR